MAVLRFLQARWRRAPASLFAAGVLLLCGLTPAPFRAQTPPAPAPQDFYFSSGRRIPLHIAPDAVGLLARDGADAREIENLGSRFGLRRPERFRGGIYLFDTGVRPRQALIDLARDLRKASLVDQAGLVVRGTGGPSHAADEVSACPCILLTDEFVVQLRAGFGNQEIVGLNRRHAVQIVRQDSGVSGLYLLSVTPQSPGHTLEIANLYAADPAVAFAHPNFVVYPELRQADDPVFKYQWHLENLGQGGGQADADVDASEAWGVTTGSPGTVIAVIDDGFDVAHPDLIPNLIGGVPNPMPTSEFDNHGTATAGLAAARGRANVGARGACPDCSLMLLRFGLTVDELAQAFYYARNMGADILSCSWGYSPLIPVPDEIKTAITDITTATATSPAMVIVFAMPDYTDEPCFDYSKSGLMVYQDISAIDAVIGVSGSTNMDRKNGNLGQGNCLDVLAPTNGGSRDIVTTDRTGITNGYNKQHPLPCVTNDSPPPNVSDPRDYTYCFGGTSAAAPIVAGAAGLALSARPSLTREEVQRLLQDTADRIEDSNGKYCAENGFSLNPSAGTSTHGYGRVNANEAVRVVAQAPSGRAGVDIFLRDNRLDWGNSQQPSHTLFESPRGFIPFWQSMDIKVDAPPYGPSTMTSAEFESFPDEDPIAEKVNHVFVRVRNRGPVTASSVNVKLHWAFAGTALPALPGGPGGFWQSFPADAADQTQWRSLGTRTIASLAYSGSSLAGGTSGTCTNGGTGDRAQVVQFDFDAPAVDLTRPSPRHYCLMAIADSLQDPVAPNSKATVIVDAITPNDNNVTHRNVVLQDSTSLRAFPEVDFYVRNPHPIPVSTVLRTVLPAGWDAKEKGFEFNRPLKMNPGEERLVGVLVEAPDVGATGEIVITQVSQDEHADSPGVMGGITLRFRPALPSAKP